MHRVRTFLKKAFTPITIMLIPHSDAKSLRIKVPSIGILASIVAWSVGVGYILTVAIDTFEYNRMKTKLDYYSGQFMELKSTMSALKKTEIEFNKLFLNKSKEKVLENIDTSDNGSLDMESIKKQIAVTMETVGEIKDYLSQQRDLYVATPKGWPVEGHISSPFGEREHPRSGEEQFHNGMDIAAEPGRPVTATADGIVSFAGWSGGSGNLVAIAHGMGYSTFYAHNKMVAVSVGQKVKRGQVIAYIGSTGNSTGPHVHYEVWHDGHPVNPDKFLSGRS